MGVLTSAGGGRLCLWRCRYLDQDWVLTGKGGLGDRAKEA